MQKSERSGERLLKAARRVSAANQFAGYTGGLGEWLGYDGLEGQRPRLTHFSTTSGAEIAFRHNFKGINHGAFEEGLDKINRINRINRIIGVGWKAFDLA